MSGDHRVAVSEAADRHFLHALRMFWYRSLTSAVGQCGLLAVFVWRYGGTPAVEDPMAVVLGAFGLATSVLAAVVAISTVGRIAIWRRAFVEAGHVLDDAGVLERAEKTQPVAKAAQAGALLPSIAASSGAAALVIYAARGL